ncbi:hypothetical protein G5I_13433 [Acromyrmex echinatior]|uniref:Uncharacterized protein n=1 Tax=Acromyrmex echinatior TaxID=103372 RepID=F4X510_ACREC|nr:hypothetical protein G5I_13433 [Acromyrmex echinatior]
MASSEDYDVDFEGHRPRVANCARHPQDENIHTVMVVAGASEQQKQHELEEESGLASMVFEGDRGAKRDKEKSRRDRSTRAVEEKIEEREILSESSRCDPV